MSVVDEFDDSFAEVPFQHSVSNSDSGIATLKNPDERLFNPATDSNNIAKKLNGSEGIEMSDITQTMAEFGSAATVEYETRDGTAKQGIDYEHQQGSLVR